MGIQAFKHPISKEKLEYEDLPEKIGSWKILENEKKNQKKVMKNHFFLLQKIKFIYLIKTKIKDCEEIII